jgi:hypothetical protein
MDSGAEQEEQRKVSNREMVRDELFGLLREAVASANPFAGTCGDGAKGSAAPGRKAVLDRGALVLCPCIDLCRPFIDVCRPIPQLKGNMHLPSEPPSAVPDVHVQIDCALWGGSHLT